MSALATRARATSALATSGQPRNRPPGTSDRVDALLGRPMPTEFMRGHGPVGTNVFQGGAHV